MNSIHNGGNSTVFIDICNYITNFERMIVWKTRALNFFNVSICDCIKMVRVYSVLALAKLRVR